MYKRQVLQIDDWNQKFGRWVNRGAHGIAVFEDADQRRQRLVHYFDISDTQPSRFSRRVPILQMRDEMCIRDRSRPEVALMKSISATHNNKTHFTRNASSLHGAFFISKEMCIRDSLRGSECKFKSGD